MEANKTKTGMITNQKSLRMAFWERIPGLSVTKERAFKRQHGYFRADVRIAFVDFLDNMQRDGQISESLAYRAILE